MKNIFLSLFAASFMFACSAQKEVNVTVENSSELDRVNEIVEVDIDQVRSKLGLADTASVVVFDASKNEIPSQITFDGKLIFPTNIVAKKSENYQIKPGTPQTYTTKTFGRQYPERMDDVAWENDKIAFRTYGPTLQNTGEKAFGYDVWVKRTEDLVLDSRYAQELADTTKARLKELKAIDPKAATAYYQTVSYHFDHGNGLDYYKVGPTLGSGTTAPIVNDSIIFPYCYASYEILDKGPLRFTTKLIYHPLVVEGDSLIETRIISLDAGSQMNKTLVSYENLSKPMTIATGLVMHDPSKDLTIAQDKGYIAYDNAADSINGQTFVGAVFPNAVKEMKSTDNHVLALNQYSPESVFTYYWGAGWTKWGFETPAQWITYLNDFSAKVKSPLTVKIK